MGHRLPRPFVLGPTPGAGPRREPGVRQTDFKPIPSPIQPQAPSGNRASLLQANLPACAALRRFTFIRDRPAPTASTRRPLAGRLALSSLRSLRSRSGAPDQRPCLFGVEFPPPGPPEDFVVPPSPPVCWSCPSHLSRSVRCTARAISSPRQTLPSRSGEEK